MSKDTNELLNYLLKKKDLKLYKASASQDFSNSLSNIVHLYLKDSAPYLMSREIGFKILERDEDNYKALALVALSLGNKIGYAVFIFDSGDLKVKELLYIPNISLMVPLTKEWVEYLSNEEDNEFSDLISSNHVQAVAPDLSPFKYSPIKRAEFEKDDDTLISIIKEFVKVPEFAYGFIKLIHKKADWVKFAATRYGIDIVEEAMKNYEIYKKKLNNKYYGGNWIGETIELKKQEEPLKIYKFSVFSKYPDLTQEEREKLLIKGYVIRDNRTEFNIPKKAPLEKLAGVFRSPTRSGIFKVDDNYILYLPVGRLQKKWCCCIWKSRDYRHIPRDMKFVLVSENINLTKNCHSIYYDKTVNLPDIEDEIEAENRLNEFIDDLPDLKTYISNLRKRKIGKDVAEHDSKQHCLLIIDPNTKEWLYGDLQLNNPLYKNELLLYYDFHSIVVVPTNSDTAYLLNTRDHDVHIAIPEHYKVFEMDSDSTYEENCIDEKYSTPSHYLNTLKEKTASFWIKYQDNKYILNDKEAYEFTRDLIPELVKRYNIKEKDAEIIVNKANSENSYYVLSDMEGNIITKQAQNPLAMAPMAPLPPGQPAPSPGAMAANMPYFGGQPMQTAVPPNAGPETLMSAPQPNVKDTAVISSMLSSADTPSIIDKYLPAVLKAINALGRLFLNLVWHNKYLSERYGTEELEAITESVRASFLRNGEIYLKLKEKSLDYDGRMLAEKPEYLTRTEMA